MTLDSINNKLVKAIGNLYPDVQYAYHGEREPLTEEEFNSGMKWIVGANEQNGAIYDNKPDEVVWADLKTEMERLQAEYEAQDYARKRKEEYPTIEELVVALYDTDDKAAIEAKRAEVKAKYPK